MKGQLSAWDFEEAPGLYHYKFKRYLGQPVGFWRTGRCGVIVEIQKYYTMVLTDEGVLVGTPYDLTDEVEVTDGADDDI